MYQWFKWPTIYRCLVFFQILHSKTYIFDNYFNLCWNASQLFVIIISKMLKLRELAEKYLVNKETSDTNLIWVIGLFMIMIAYIWNNASQNMNYARASVLNYNQSSFSTLSRGELKLWRQSIFIDWEEYIIDINKKN